LRGGNESCRQLRPHPRRGLLEPACGTVLLRVLMVAEALKRPSRALNAFARTKCLTRQPFPGLLARSESAGADAAL
jgi:hypothetical protein